MINWYNEVSRNLSKIPDCVAYYDAELLEAKKQCKVYGNLERASASLPGIVEERFSQLQHLEAILEYLNLENYNKLLSSRDAEKYVDGEDDVVDMTKIINDFALIRNQWLGITKGLDQKQWQITNIVKLRVAGMEDADIG